MHVHFNDQFIETAASTLIELLEEKNLANKSGIAVAINDLVVQRVNWPVQQLCENDVILVITAAAGG